MQVVRVNRIQYIEKEVEIDLYITTDGREYEDKEEAETHEKRLGVTSLVFNNKLPENLSIHYVSSTEDIHTLMKDDFDSEAQNLEQVERIKFPCWIGINSVDYYSYGASQSYYDLNQLRSDIEETVASYESILEKISLGIE